jgi:hypothetical protein
MKRNETLLHLALIMEKCNSKDLPCDLVISHFCDCVEELADNVIAFLKRTLSKPEFRTCRISLVIDFEKMTNPAYWLSSDIFSCLPTTKSNALKEKFITLTNLLRELEIRKKNVDPRLAESFFKRMMARVDQKKLLLDYQIWRANPRHLTIDQLKKKEIQLTADLLMSGVLKYDEMPTLDELKAVKVDLVQQGMSCDTKLSDDFETECAKIRRYSYWVGEKNEMFMIDYNLIYIILYQYCFEKLTQKQRMTLFEYDVQLKMIHEDMVRLKPELAKYLHSTKNEQTNNNQQETTEELFHFIHPSVDETEEWQIHNEVKRLVTRQSVQMICQYLLQMRKDNKTLLPPNPSAAYVELVRMGMPSGEGFTESTFRKYYSNK